MSRSAEDQAFLRAIIAQPDADLPRLVYADWLDETGDGERAELIRVQIELANCRHTWLPGSETTCHMCGPLSPLRRRAWELMGANNEAWLTALPPATDRTWRRGFVEEIELSWPAWVEQARRWRVTAPIQRIRLLPLPFERDLRARPGLGWSGLEFETVEGLWICP
jgi:uncharacterized protein (TIGR02996 family)